MKFNTYTPCDRLKPFVRTMAIAESADAQAYKVLPDTGVMICLQYKINSSHFDTTHSFLMNSSGVTGIQDRYQMHNNSTDSGAILVSFKAGYAAPFFRLPLHELFRESVLLDNFMPGAELRKLEEQLCEAHADIEKIKVVENFLISRIHLASQDTLILAALQRIQNSSGNIRIKDLVEQLSISQSALEKRFRAVVGASPKKIASIVRLKHIIEHYNPQVSPSDLGYTAGFYDQAHFIKAFKSFTGETPDSFFTKI